MIKKELLMANKFDKVRAEFIAIIFLLTVASPILSSSVQAQGELEVLPHLASLPATQTQVHIDWNSHHYDWEDLKDNETGKVRVILAVDKTALTGLTKDLQRALDDTADDVYDRVFSGFSAELSVQTIEHILKTDPSIQIQPDFKVQASVAVNQTGADIMWNRTDPWGYDVEGHNVIIAIVDTGIDYNHPDLGGGFGPTYKVLGGYDYVNGDSDPMDDSGHGTHCAGIAAANGTIKGVAPDAKLYAYKSLDSSGYGYYSNVISGINAAIGTSDIISLSLGGAGTPGDAICVAVAAAVDAGLVVAAAAGNDGPSMGSVGTPGIEPKAITVGAIDSSNVLASWSSRGTTPYVQIKPEISAPGVSIYSTYKGGGYKTMSGTSMATPHVAGVAALILQVHPDWSPVKVKSAMLSGSYNLTDSFWRAGAGGLWAPGAANSAILTSEPMLSLGYPNGVNQSAVITNIGLASTFTLTSMDWHSIWYNGTLAPKTWTNISNAMPSELVIAENSTGTMWLNVTVPSESNPEGYYDAVAYVTNETISVRLPFGYVVLSEVRVYVRDMAGDNISDGTGKVVMYDYPDAEISVAKWGIPPTFLVPSGTYSVHADGHQLIYSFPDPYMLSGNITVGKLTTVEVYLNMTDAHAMALDLETDGGHPIYVKDYRTYFRHVGARNVSFDVTCTDYTIIGSEIFALPKSITIYVSNTLDTVGISIAGLSYSSAMWSFMELNWQHWYEYTSGTSTNFMKEASADLEYLLSWEYDGITPSTPSVLSWDEGSCREYVTKFDIPGTLTDPWLNWGNHRAFGADAVFWVRRDTDTSLNPFFSGMTRTIFVKGVFTDIYYPRNVLDGFAETQMYVPDYDYLVHAATVAEIYLPDRNFLSPLLATTVDNRVGMGPFFSAVRTENTNDTLVLFQPLLRDQSGAKIGMMSTPTMYLYKNGPMVGITVLSEIVARPDAVRYIDLSGPGNYKVSIDTPLSSQVSNDVLTEFGFYVPGNDRDPPRILGLNMSQKFVPGATVPINLTAEDTVSSVTVNISTRPGSGSWTYLTVTPDGFGGFSASIPTTVSDPCIDLKVRVNDSTGNYILFTVTNAALEQVPVLFNLTCSPSVVEYADTSATIVLKGNLTNEGGSPLHGTGAVPLELRLEGTKVGMILDEYVLAGSHSHNGTIRFPWVFNPTNFFTGPDQTITINVTFDMGIYEQMNVSFNITSYTEGDPEPPVITSTPTITSVVEDSQYSYDCDATDASTWSLAGNCTSFLSIDPYSGLVSGTPDNSEAEQIFDVNITVSNLYGSDWQNFTVNTWNIPPSITPPSTSGVHDILYSVNIQHDDEGLGTPPGNYTSLTTNVSDSYTFNYTNGWLNWTPSALGYYWWNVTADDQVGLDNSTAYLNWTVVVAETRPLIINSPTSPTTVWALYWFNATATPADSGTNIWAFETNATWLSLVWTNETQYNVSGTPTSIESIWLKVSVEDDDSGQYINVTIIVQAGPPPTITSTPDMIALEDSEYNYYPIADQTIDTWSLTITNASWISLTPANGRTYGTPDNSNAGRYYWVNISCSNMNGTAEANWTITVWNVQPVFTSSPIINAVNNSLYSYNALTTDESVGNTSYSVNSNASFSYDIVPLTGVLTFTPDNIGIYWFNITVDDGSYWANATQYQNFTVTVSEFTPLVQTTPSYFCIVWVVYYYNASCTPPDSGPTVWVFITNASWLLFVSGGSGTNYYNVSGTPTTFGVFWANLTVSDGDSSDYINWTVTIQIGPLPSFTSSPSSDAWEDHPFSYTATADQSVTWYFWTDASWLVVSSPSISGTPDNSYSELTFNIHISITTMNGTVWQNFSVSVSNNLPTFSSTPDAWATVGIAYGYNATTDDEGVGTPAPTYSLSTNFMGWYSFNTTTGQLIFAPTVEGTFWFNVSFDDMRGASNSTAYQNFTVTVLPLEIIPPGENNPLSPGSVWPSFKYVVSGLSVSFSDNSYGSMVQYIWDFGDGKGSNKQNPVHLYDKPAIYNVTLTIIGADNKSYVVTARINVGEDLPITQTPEGWRIALTETLVIDVSAVGLLVVGSIMWISTSFIKETLVITRKGRRVIGALMIGVSLYYFFFVDTGWMG